MSACQRRCLGAVLPDAEGLASVSADVTFSGMSVLQIQRGLKTQSRRIAKNLRVRLPTGTVPDDPGIFPGACAAAGTYKARLAALGAVIIETNDGDVGVKPGEFHFVCPWFQGETHLADHGRGRKVWTVVPRCDRARVRVLETWRTFERPTDMVDGIRFAADDAFVPIENTRDAADRWVRTHDNGKYGTSWRPPRYMPRWAVRHQLDVTLAQLVRLQDISREDAIAEGMVFTDYGFHEHQLSADGGKTWGITRTLKAGWSFGGSTRSDQCLGSPVQAFGNTWNALYAGENWNLKAYPHPWDENPWVWAYTFTRVSSERATCFGDGGQVSSGHPDPRATQQEAATPSQGDSLATGNVAESQVSPGTIARADHPPSPPFRKA
jgi:hypothetical protein